MNLDNPCSCPNCGEHMELSLPIWVKPGYDIDVGEVDWESGNRQCSSKWWCNECEEHNLPFPVQETLTTDENTMTCGVCERSWDDSIVTSMTPVPAGRCPFECFHEDNDE